MTSVVKHLVKQGLIKPPGFVDGNIQYETVMGSEAYGSATSSSDIDIYGFCIPPQNVLFPHIVGIIPGFDRNVQGFEQYQQHHIMDADAHAGKGQEYDIQIFNIVKYFRLCLDGNPNMIDSLFTPQDCVRFQTTLAVEVRDNRRLFLSMDIVPKFRGYALSQIGKMVNKKIVDDVLDLEHLECTYEELQEVSIDEIDELLRNGMSLSDIPMETLQEYSAIMHRVLESKRAEQINIGKADYDVKFAMHAIRLLCELEQILETGDIDLRRDAEFYKAVRRGDFTREEIVTWVDHKALHLEEIKSRSLQVIPSKPKEKEVKELLVNCLEQHYGTLGDALILPDRYKSALMDIQDAINKALG